MKMYIHLWQYLAEFFSEWDTFQTKLSEKIKTNFMINNNILIDNVVKYGRDGQATDDNNNMVCALCMLDN